MLLKLWIIWRFLRKFVSFHIRGRNIVTYTLLTSIEFATIMRPTTTIMKSYFKTKPYIMSCCTWHKLSGYNLKLLMVTQMSSSVKLSSHVDITILSTYFESHACMYEHVALDLTGFRFNGPQNLNRQISSNEHCSLMARFVVPVFEISEP